MKLNYFLISALALPAAAFSYSLRGNVIDAVTGEPEPGASVKLYLPQDTVKFVSAVVTDNDGNFIMEADRSGDYILRISFPGMADALVNVSLTDGNPEIITGAVPLYPIGEKLDEVIVMGRKPVIQSDGEKVTYNIAEDPSSGQKTVIEMLRKVPMVTVDAEDNIKVNGSSDFQIYLNGVPNPMLSQNASQVLKSLPASAVRKIEVVLEPGAKYDAEGTGGILNIVTETKQQSNDGYSATVTLGANNRNANTSVFGMMKRDKVTASVNLSYFNNRFDDTEITGKVERHDFKSVSGYHTVQDLFMSQRNDFLNGSFNVSWEPDRNNLFTASGNIMYGSGNVTSNVHSRIYTATGLFGVGSTQWMRADWKWGSYSLNASFQHNFKGDGHNIVFSYQYEHGISENPSYQLYYDLENMDMMHPALYNYSDSPTNSNTVQLDYTLPFLGKYKFETGAKWIFRRNRSDGYTIYGDNLSDIDISSQLRDDNVSMKQHQDVGAVYASIGGTWNRLNAKAGLRYEYTDMGVDFLTHGYDDFNSYLNDIVPNAAVGYSFSQVSNLRASYQMRIRRPSISDLNPHKTTVLANTVNMGNPSLASEKTHNISLTYSRLAGIFGINLVASYKFSDNMIGSYYYVDNGTFYCTQDNIGKNQNASISAYFNVNPSQKVNFSVNATGRYLHYDFGVDGASALGWTGDLGANVNWFMPWKLTFNAYADLSFKDYELQGNTSGYHYYGLSLSRTFLKEDKLKISVNASNFLEKDLSMKRINYGRDFWNCMQFGMPLWSVGASVSYTFGGFSGTVKKTMSEIVNDDVLQSKGGGGSPL